MFTILASEKSVKREILGRFRLRQLMKAAYYVIVWYIDVLNFRSKERKSPRKSTSLFAYCNKRHLKFNYISIENAYCQMCCSTNWIYNSNRTISSFTWRFCLGYLANLQFAFISELITKIDIQTEKDTHLNTDNYQLTEQHTIELQIINVLVILFTLRTH